MNIGEPLLTPVARYTDFRRVVPGDVVSGAGRPANPPRESRCYPALTDRQRSFLVVSAAVGPRSPSRERFCPMPVINRIADLADEIAAWRRDHP